MKPMQKLLFDTFAFFEGMPGNIQHLLKVRDFALLIGRDEGFKPDQMEVLEAAAIVHDVGIRLSLERYGDAAGAHQEELGPEAVRTLMAGWPAEVINRVCWLVAHHHSYADIREKDHQVLVEADFLVNFFEHGSPAEEIREVRDRLFRTAMGSRLCRLQFGV